MLATTSSAIAGVLTAIIIVGWVVYAVMNRSSSKRELGSEMELAPNRKAYYDDETLEGPRLERMQILGVLMLGALVIGLPAYWIHEPSRQAGAVEEHDDEFNRWGTRLFATTAEGGFNCAGCHGAAGGGGNAPAAITDPKTGEVKSVSWYAPAVNTIFYRFSHDEVKFILNYGRPFSPMSAWGTIGGGPMNDQQIETILEHLKRLQISPVGCLDPQPFSVSADPSVCAGGSLPQKNKEDIAKQAAADAQNLVDAGKYTTVDAAMGEALYNLNRDSGAYSCARCHTPGWSWGDPGATAQGAFGWNLTGGAVSTHFPNEADMIAFIKAGSQLGKKYGTQGQGSGRMPGFGALLTDEQIKQIVEYVRGL